tara:strand:- start:303 stop:527 length:225 start_codon:yes stop_codon:yes gene_type:complete
MKIIHSKTNGCSYTLWKGCVLFYHPQYDDDVLETQFYKYAEVEWDLLDDDVLKEADRCYDILRTHSKVSLALAS